MAINLKDLKPTKVSKNLKGKFLFLYGSPKIGKTTLASQFPKNIIMGFEHGFNLLDNVYAVDVPTWAEFRKYVKQLEDPDMQEMFNTITIDTVSIAYERCQTYICNKHQVDSIGEIPFGQGFQETDREFADVMRKITQLGYGIVFIGHEKVRVETDGQTSCKYISPDLPDRCAKIINRMVDLTAYIGMENKNRYIYPRQTVITEGTQKVDIYAGSHFANLNNKIELGYDTLVDAIAEAMTTNSKGEKIELVDAPVAVQQDVQLDFKEIRLSIGKTAKKLSQMDEGLEEPHYMNDYRAIVEKYLGKGKLVKDCDESQVEHLSLILDDLQDYAAKNNIE